MKKVFTTQNFLSENRNYVIDKYNEMATDNFFNGISLREFMMQVLNVMNNNNPKSEKRAASLFKDVVSLIIVNNTKIDAIDKKTERLRELNKGTSAMALV